MTCRDREEPGLRADSECRALSGAHSRPWGQPPEGPRHSRGRLNDLGGQMLSGGKREAEGIALRRRIRAGVHGANPGGRSRAGTGRHSHPSPGHVRAGRGPPSVEAAWGGQAVHHRAWGVASLAGRGAGSGGLGTTRPPRSQPDPWGRQEVGPSRCGGGNVRDAQSDSSSRKTPGAQGAASPPLASASTRDGGSSGGRRRAPAVGHEPGTEAKRRPLSPGRGRAPGQPGGENGEKVPEANGSRKRRPSAAHAATVWLRGTLRPRPAACSDSGKGASVLGPRQDARPG